MTIEFNEDGSLKVPGFVEKDGKFFCWKCDAPLNASNDVCLNCNPKENAEFFCKSCDTQSKIILDEGMLICENCRAIKGVKR